MVLFFSSRSTTITFSVQTRTQEPTISTQFLRTGKTCLNKHFIQLNFEIFLFVTVSRSRPGTRPACVQVNRLTYGVSLEINWQESEANHFNPLSRLRLDGVSPPTFSQGCILMTWWLSTKLFKSWVLQARSEVQKF